MDSKLDYVTRIFKKSQSKGIESYVIGRIWHLLNDTDIKIVPQQYVKRPSQKYALTDIFFPQINLHVEINEAAHYSTSDRITADEIRRNEIESSTNHTVIAIQCTGSLEDIHKQVRDLVQKIKYKIAEQKRANTFIPWNPELEKSPKFYSERGYLDTAENVVLHTIEGIGQLFDAHIKNRGFLKPGATNHPINDSMMIWWPSLINRKGWKNSISQDETVITEQHSNPDKQKSHVKYTLQTSRIQRIVFLQGKDILGYKYYRFKGVFELDRQSSNPENGIIWRKTADRYVL